jgi:hypothetical protein
MATDEALKNRYPGLQPFGKQQAGLFFGREVEKKDLFNLVTLEKVVVLFGRSGLGKSSLLNAGLSPLLEDDGYRPIRVRFSPGNATNKSIDAGENLLIRDFIIAFNGFDNQDEILFDKTNPQLWEFIKTSRFINDKGVVQTPVFIFDQFEEFFYHPPQHQEAFLKQLSEVVHEQPPRRILDWATNIDEDARTPEQIAWHKQPALKIIFSLRSDKLSLMQQLAPYISTVLRNRYELKPLNPKQAKDAIAQPAEKEMSAEYTPKFRFNAVLVDEIVNELSNDNKEIESSQLQMVCNHIENKVVESHATEVTESIIVPKLDIPKIRENFYEDQLAKITDEKDRLLARKVIEDDLVIDGQRASLLAKQIHKKLQGKKELIELLVNARLIREEATNRGLTYEVSHDTLVPTIEKSKQIRLAGEEQLRKEEERVRLESENTRLAKETAEKNARIAEESKLRQMAEQERTNAQQEKKKAEVLKVEAENQREAKELQRQRARRYFFVAATCAFLALGAGVYLAFSWRRAKTAEQTARRAEKNAQDLREDLAIQKIRLERSADSLKSLTILLLEQKSKQTIYTAEDDNALNFRVLKQAHALDTQNKQINELIDNLYQQEVQKGSIPDKTPQNTGRKIELLEKRMKNFNIDDYQKNIKSYNEYELPNNIKKN